MPKARARSAQGSSVCIVCGEAGTENHCAGDSCSGFMLCYELADEAAAKTAFSLCSTCDALVVASDRLHQALLTNVSTLRSRRGGDVNRELQDLDVVGIRLCDVPEEDHPVMPSAEEGSISTFDGMRPCASTEFGDLVRETSADRKNGVVPVVPSSEMRRSSRRRKRSSSSVSGARRPPPKKIVRKKTTPGVSYDSNGIVDMKEAPEARVILERLEAEPPNEVANRIPCNTPPGCEGVSSIKLEVPTWDRPVLLQYRDDDVCGRKLAGRPPPRKRVGSKTKPGVSSDSILNMKGAPNSRIPCDTPACLDVSSVKLEVVPSTSLAGAGDMSEDSVDQKEASYDEDPQKPYSCAKCRLKFTKAQYEDGSYAKHVAWHDAADELKVGRFRGDWMRCPHCPYQAKRADSIQKHVKRRHGDGLGNNYKCDVCDERFVEASVKRTHMYKVHYKKFPFLCSRCGKGFYTKAGVQFHAEGGCKEGPVEMYMCEVCGKEVKAATYKKHYRIFHNPKLNQCPYCDVACVKKVSLTNHLAKFHGIGEPVKRPKPAANECRHCGKKIGDKGFFLAHMFLEHGERLKGLKEFKCEYCSKIFYTKANFEAHVLNHTGVKKHECAICGYKTNYSGNLSIHMKRVHKQGPETTKEEAVEESSAPQEVSEAGETISGQTIDFEKVVVNVEVAQPSSSLTVVPSEDSSIVVPATVLVQGVPVTHVDPHTLSYVQDFVYNAEDVKSYVDAKDLIVMKEDADGTYEIHAIGPNGGLTGLHVSGPN